MLFILFVYHISPDLLSTHPLDDGEKTNLPWWTTIQTMILWKTSKNRLTLYVSYNLSSWPLQFHCVLEFPPRFYLHITSPRQMPIKSSTKQFSVSHHKVVILPHGCKKKLTKTWETIAEAKKTIISLDKSLSTL